MPVYTQLSCCQMRLAAHTGGVGLYLALTGKRLSKPADLLRTGIATHFVKAARLPQLTEALGTRTLRRASSKSLALSGLEPILQQFDVRLHASLLSAQFCQLAKKPSLCLAHRCWS